MRRFVRVVMAVAVGAVAVAVAIPGSPDAQALTPQAPVFHGGIIKHAKVGKPFHAMVAAKASPVSAITPAAALPAGLTFTDLGIGKGTLTGSFTAPGTFTIGFNATNSLGTATETMTVTVTGIAAVSTYCGQRTGTPTTSKVMVIYEENHSYSSIVGSTSAPAINSYATSCGKATNYQALTHPSLPNYMESTSGVSYASTPWSSDCSPSVSCSTTNDNIFNQVGPTRWKSYAESMSANCSTSGSSYAARHNPAEYYTNLSASCATNDVPLGTTTSGALHSDVTNGTLPTFSTVTPNLINDMHDGTITQGDNWLAAWMPVITSGPDYQSGHLTILIVWDEGSGSGNSASPVLMLAVSPYVVPGTSSATAFTHYSLLKAAEDVAGVSELANAATANSLRTAFGF